MNVDSIPEPEEDWMFYIHPLGHGLYMRSTIGGERRERPVFTHNAAPTWHLSGCHSDQDCFDAEAPSKDFWKCVRLIYAASQQDSDEKYREFIEKAHTLSEKLEYHETDTIDKLFGQLHQLECPPREIEVFDRLFAEVEDKDTVAEAVVRIQEKWEQLKSSDKGDS